MAPAYDRMGRDGPPAVGMCRNCRKLLVNYRVVLAGLYKYLHSPPKGTERPEDENTGDHGGHKSHHPHKLSELLKDGNHCRMKVRS